MAKKVKPQEEAEEDKETIKSDVTRHIYAMVQRKYRWFTIKTPIFDVISYPLFTTPGHLLNPHERDAVWKLGTRLLFAPPGQTWAARMHENSINLFVKGQLKEAKSRDELARIAVTTARMAEWLDAQSAYRELVETRIPDSTDRSKTIGFQECYENMFTDIAILDAIQDETFRIKGTETDYERRLYSWGRYKTDAAAPSPYCIRNRLFFLHVCEKLIQRHCTSEPNSLFGNCNITVVRRQTGLTETPASLLARAKKSTEPIPIIDFFPSEVQQYYDALMFTTPPSPDGKDNGGVYADCDLTLFVGHWDLIPPGTQAPLGRNW